MSKSIHIGLVLAHLPRFSETFIISKINGLVSSGFKISLFINAPGRGFEDFDDSVGIFYKINRHDYISLMQNLIKLFFYNTKVVFKFLIAEIRIGRSFFLILKNLINNCHILSKKKFRLASF